MDDEQLERRLKRIEDALIPINRAIFGYYNDVTNEPIDGLAQSVVDIRDEQKRVHDDLIVSNRSWKRYGLPAIFIGAGSATCNFIINPHSAEMFGHLLKGVFGQ